MPHMYISRGKTYTAAERQVQYILVCGGRAVDEHYRLLPYLVRLLIFSIAAFDATIKKSYIIQFGRHTRCFC